VLLGAISGLSEWGEFYVITGTSAGALGGLMFVVIALRAERSSQAIEEVEAYATPTVVHFTTVVILAGIITVPEQTELSLGLCLVAAGLAGLAYSVWVTFQARRTPYADVLTDWIWRSVLPGLGYAGFVAAAPLLWWDTDAALYVAAAVALLFISVGIHNAWDAAVWIASDHE
jgi:hypothetical protein